MRGIVLSFLAIFLVSGQTQPAFDVASVKPSAADASSSGVATGHGRVNANNVTLKRCIMNAYGVGPHEISGGPDWLDTDRFEISAKADQPVNDDAVLMLMLQGLLAERFKLAIHRETRTIPVFVLDVAKSGPKLEKGAGGDSSTTQTSNNTGTILDARDTTLESFAKILARYLDLPVVNQTAIEGAFNLKLQWTPERASGAPREWPSIFTAIQEQLGLRLSSRKAPVEVLVIDHAEKPSEN